MKALTLSRSDAGNALEVRGSKCLFCSFFFSYLINEVINEGIRQFICPPKSNSIFNLQRKLKRKTLTQEYLCGQQAYDRMQDIFF